MNQPLPFHPAQLPIEQEGKTRARHSNTVCLRAQANTVRHADYRLDEMFSACNSSCRRDNFTPDYEETDVHITTLESGILIGGHGLVIDLNYPTLSTQRSSFINQTRLHGQWNSLQYQTSSKTHTYLVGSNNVYRNHYHWMFQCLPSMMLLRQQARQQGLDYRIVLPQLDPRHEHSLKLLGIDRAECVTLLDGHYIADVRLMYTSAMSGRHMFQPSASLLALLEPYREACLKNIDQNGLPERFYVSRRDSTQRRALINEEQLIQTLENEGYSPIVLSDLTLEEQTALFAGAKAIVAPHGAGLVNLMFAGSDARLVEIMPQHYRSAHFFRLSQCRGMRYTEVCAHSVDRENTCLQSSVEVDIDKVLQALNHD